MKRVLIEFYSPHTPENLLSVLNGIYDKVYYLYCPTEQAPKPSVRKQLDKVVTELLGIRPHFFVVPSLTIDKILEALHSLYQPKNQYEIDITGGNEIFIVAAGIFLHSKDTENIRLHRYDIHSGKRSMNYPAVLEEAFPFPRFLSAEQALALNGTPPLQAPKPNFLGSALENEVLALWNAVRDNTKEWNRFCSLPSYGEPLTDGFVRKCLGEKDSDCRSYSIIANKLKSAGIIDKEHILVKNGKKYGEFQLKVPREALFLYDKAGSLLELYTALAAWHTGNFHDIRVGVTVDWNGKIELKYHPDPRNEIDLFLMHGNLPVVTSCKNAVPINEYLYEIMIMAKHYGGQYATPMLLATGRASPTVKKRAAEMGIVLIDRIRFRSLEELCTLFAKHFPAI